MTQTHMKCNQKKKLKNSKKTKTLKKKKKNNQKQNKLKPKKKLEYSKITKIPLNL